MRVTITSDHFVPHRSGHAVAVGWWLRALANLELRLTVIGDAPAPEPLPNGIDAWLSTPRLPGFTYGHPVAALRPFGNTLAQLRENPPDLLHAHGYGPLVRQVCAAFPGVPLVLTLHSLPVGSGAPRVPGLQALMRRWLADAVARARLVTVPSAVAAQRLRRGWGCGVRVVPSGVDACFTAGGPTRVMAEGEHRYLYVGRWSQEKNFDQFQRLARANPHHHWTAMGHGPQRPRTPVRALAYRDSAGVMTALAAADALLAPGLHETQGLVVLEALHRRVAVAAPYGSAQAEMICDGQNGACYPAADDAAAAAALRRAAALTRAGGVRVPPAYAGAALAQAMVAVYREALG